MSEAVLEKRKIASPVSDRLMNAMREFIAESSPGRRLPSEPSLVAKYGISRKTAGRVYGKLEDEGKIVRRRGSGSYVAAQPVFTFMLPCPGYLAQSDTFQFEMKGIMTAAAERGIVCQTLVASLTNDSENLDLSCLSRLNRFSMVFLSVWFYHLFPELARRQCRVALLHSQDIPYGSRQYVRNWTLLEIDRKRLIRERMDELYRMGKRRIALIAPFILSEKDHAFYLAYKEKTAEYGLPEIVLETTYPPYASQKRLHEFWQEQQYDALLFNVITNRFYPSVCELFGIPESVPSVALNINRNSLKFERPPVTWVPDYEKIAYDAVSLLADGSCSGGRTCVYQFQSSRENSVV